MSKPNIVDLAAEREERTPHLSGNAFCMFCNHEWIAVAPVGTTWLECPGCHGHKGQFKFEFEPPEREVWACCCGNQLFNVTRKGIFCPMCGHYNTFP